MAAPLAPVNHPRSGYRCRILHALLAAFVPAALLALAAPGAQAQMYRWVDDQGRVRYTDTPPPASAKDGRKLAPQTGAGPAAAPGSAGAKPPAAKLPEVTLYTNSGCGPLCADARQHLVARGVPFREVSVESPETLDELRKLSGGLSVPLLLIGDAMQKGFDPARYAYLLDSAGFPKAGAARVAAPPPGRYLTPPN